MSSGAGKRRPGAIVQEIDISYLAASEQPFG